MSQIREDQRPDPHRRPALPDHVEHLTDAVHMIRVHMRDKAVVNPGAALTLKTRENPTSAAASDRRGASVNQHGRFLSRLDQNRIPLPHRLKDDLHPVKRRLPQCQHKRRQKKKQQKTPPASPERPQGK